MREKERESMNEKMKYLNDAFFLLNQADLKLICAEEPKLAGMVADAMHQIEYAIENIIEKELDKKEG